MRSYKQVIHHLEMILNKILTHKDVHHSAVYISEKLGHTHPPCGCAVIYLNSALLLDVYASIQMVFMMH